VLPLKASGSLYSEELTDILWSCSRLRLRSKSQEEKREGEEEGWGESTAGCRSWLVLPLKASGSLYSEELTDILWSCSRLRLRSKSREKKREGEEEGRREGKKARLIRIIFRSELSADGRLTEPRIVSQVNRSVVRELFFATFDRSFPSSLLSSSLYRYGDLEKERIRRPTPRGCPSSIFESRDCFDLDDLTFLVSIGCSGTFLRDFWSLLSFLCAVLLTLSLWWPGRRARSTSNALRLPLLRFRITRLLWPHRFQDVSRFKRKSRLDLPKLRHSTRELLVMKPQIQLSWNKHAEIETHPGKSELAKFDCFSQFSAPLSEAAQVAMEIWASMTESEGDQLGQRNTSSKNFAGFESKCWSCQLRQRSHVERGLLRPVLVSADGSVLEGRVGVPDRWFTQDKRRFFRDQ